MQKIEMLEIARLAAREVLSQRKKIIDDEFEQCYHEVSLIMKNYRKLKSHYANAPTENPDARTVYLNKHEKDITIEQVDKMLNVYKSFCQETACQEETRRWEALYLRYISDEILNVDDIAERLYVDKRTFYRDINRALEDMAVLLFGIVAIGTWKQSK